MLTPDKRLEISDRMRDQCCGASRGLWTCVMQKLSRILASTAARPFS